jgi:hypothetical protein
MIQAARVLLALVVCTLSVAAEAHGFAERYDLPVPLRLYVGGSAAAVALSFVVVAYFVRGDRTVQRYPTFNLLGTVAGRVLASRVFGFVLRFFALFMLVLVVVAGLIGDDDPFKNIAPTTVWVIWWVGLAYVSGMLGDLWALLNPWRTVFEVTEWLLTRLKPNMRLGLNMDYPERAGSWPAVVLFVWFIWAELIWPASDSPAELSLAVINYSVITWIGMLVFGSRNWLRHGEVFTLLFGLLARFAPTEFLAERREWNLRPWAVGLLPDKPMSLSLTVFVLLMLSSVTFDGLLATPHAHVRAGPAARTVNAGYYRGRDRGDQHNRTYRISPAIPADVSGVLHTHVFRDAREGQGGPVDRRTGQTVRTEHYSDSVGLSSRALPVVSADRRPVHDSTRVGSSANWPDYSY